MVLRKTLFGYVTYYVIIKNQFPVSSILTSQRPLLLRRSPRAQLALLCRRALVAAADLLHRLDDLRQWWSQDFTEPRA